MATNDALVLVEVLEAAHSKGKVVEQIFPSSQEDTNGKTDAKDCNLLHHLRKVNEDVKVFGVDIGTRNLQGNIQEATVVPLPSFYINQEVPS